MAREKQGRKACSTFLIVDAQSVKNTDTGGQKGYDAGKKVSGIKRHIAVDTQGLPHAIAVTTAEVTDRKGALQSLDRCKANLGQVQSLLCDSGYTGEPFAEGVREILGKQVTVQIAKRRASLSMSTVKTTNAGQPGFPASAGSRVQADGIG